MDTNDVILIILGGIIAGLLYIVNKNGGRLAESVPSSVLVTAIDMLIALLRSWAVPAAEKTPSTVDDETIRQGIALLEALKEALTKGAPLPQPTVEEIVGSGADGTPVRTTTQSVETVRTTVTGEVSNG